MVEWKKLGDLCEVQRGKRLTKNLLDDNAAYPVYHGGLDPLGKYGQYNREANTVMVINVGASAGTVGFCNCKFWSSDGCFCISHSKLLDNKYLYYYLQTKTHYLQSQVRHAGIPTLDNPVVEKIMLPLLSMSEQKQIVGILDTFTSSINNLKHQIAQRRKQYEYYRDQLLDIEGKVGVKNSTLGKIGNCTAGATPSTKIAEYWEGGTIPWMSSGEVHQKIVTHTASFITKKGYDNASTKMLPVNTIVIALAGQGKTRGTVAITAIELCTNQSLCGIIIDNAEINNKYVYYYMTTRYNDLRRISSGEGTRGGLNLKMIASYPIPLPSLSEQQRIVDILDKFEASIQNLEAQLSQREKQYEYYRNKLLTFE
jgi:type I restriction enzyme S subunit